MLGKIIDTKEKRIKTIKEILKGNCDREKVIDVLLSNGFVGEEILEATCQWTKWFIDQKN